MVPVTAGTTQFTGDILMEHGVITEVSPRIPADAANCEIVDVTGKIVVPGFADTHRHIWQSPFRYVGADWLISHYAKAMWGTAGPVYTPDDLYMAIWLGLAEALNAGVTQVFDWNHNVNSPEHADATVSAHRDSGARVVFGYGQSSAVWREMLDPAVGTSRAMPSADLERVRSKYYSSDDGLLTLAMAARGPEVSPMDVVAAEAKQARSLGLRQSIHIGNGAWAHKQPVRLMAEQGLLGDDITWVHCNTLTDEQLQLIADSGGTASCATELEQHMGHGDPAINRLLAVGLRPSLSVDTCTNVSGDLFAVMRATLAAARAASNARVLETGVMLTAVEIGACDVLEFGTLQGAAANGLGGKTGSIETGKRADLVVIAANSPNLMPITYAAGSVVMGAHPGNVDAVLVDGKFVKRDGVLVNIDSARLKTDSENLRDRLFAKIGVPVGPWIPSLD